MDAFASTENDQVDDDQHQYYDVEAYPVRDRGAIEHHPMLAYGDLLKERGDAPNDNGEDGTSIESG